MALEVQNLLDADAIAILYAYPFLLVIIAVTILSVIDKGSTFIDCLAVDVISTSSGYSWTMKAYCPAPGVGSKSPADNDYKPGFAAELMLKDLRLSQQASNADTPLGQKFNKTV